VDGVTGATSPGYDEPPHAAIKPPTVKTPAYLEKIYFLYIRLIKRIK
jgi:hypothetical protein